MSAPPAQLAAVAQRLNDGGDGADNATFFQVFPACNDGCVVTAIFNYSSILYKSRSSIKSGVCTTSTTAEPCALSFVTHFVGDVHQPMHVRCQQRSLALARCRSRGSPLERRWRLC